MSVGIISIAVSSGAFRYEPVLAAPAIQHQKCRVHFGAATMHSAPRGDGQQHRRHTWEDGNVERTRAGCRKRRSTYGRCFS